MSNTQYTESDRDAVKILRDAYMQVDGLGGDALYDARQYLQDRSRYESLYSAGKRWSHATEAM